MMLGDQEVKYCTLPTTVVRQPIIHTVLITNFVLHKTHYNKTESNDYVMQTNIRLVRTITWTILMLRIKGSSEWTEPSNGGSATIKTHIVLPSIWFLLKIHTLKGWNQMIITISLVSSRCSALHRQIYSYSDWSSERMDPTNCSTRKQTKTNTLLFNQDPDLAKKHISCS
jgi:hypothetical protein